MENTQDTASGKTSPAFSPPTEEMISKLSSKQLSELKKKGSRCLRLRITDGQKRTYIWETDGAWLTEFSMLNSGACHSEEQGSTLVCRSASLSLRDTSPTGRDHADFAGESAGEVLFKSEGLSGYTPEGFFTWQRTAGGAEKNSGEAGGRYCINTQGQSGVSVTVDHAGTLVAQDHVDHPAVLHAAGFSTEHSAKARSIGYEEEISPTLRVGVVPAAIGLYENHGMDSRFRGPLKVAHPVTATYGMGGNDQPFVVEDAECYDVRFTSEGTKNARQNCYKTNTARTIDTGGNSPDPNQGGVAVLGPKAYGICSKHSNAMLSDNPHSGFYEADTSRTIDTSDQSPNKNQGGICVISPETYSLQGSMIGRSDENGPQGDGINEDVCFTLNTADRHAVAAPDPSYTISRDNHFAISEDVSVTAVAKGPATVAVPTDHYCTSKNSHHTVAAHEQANTLVASDWKDPPLVNDTPNDEPVYIVRRLTPVECARLQGFPDWWCADLAIPNPSDEEIVFWTEVWDTWRQVTNPKGKPKTEKQIRKWLAAPYTDSAEYKLWGNGVSLPITFFVLSGIEWAYDRGLLQEMNP